MKKIAIAAAAATFGGMAAFGAVLFKSEGQITEKTPGWQYHAKDEKGKMTPAPWSADSPGRLFTRRIKLSGKAPGKGAFYRIKFSAKHNAPHGAVEPGINFYDAKGKLLPDLHDTMYAGPERDYDRVFFAMGKVDSVEIFFVNYGRRGGFTVRDVTLEDADEAAARDYANALYAQLPPVEFTAPAEACAAIPRTIEALKTGKPWRVVMLGDSIVQDTFHSMFFAKLRQTYPAMNVEWVLSMRGGTGCWFYTRADAFKEYVYDEKPDLLIIGGISQMSKDDSIDKGKHQTWIEAMESVGRAAQAHFGCEVLLCDAPLAVDTRHYDPENPAAPLPKQIWNVSQEERMMDKGWNIEGKRDGIAQRNKWASWHVHAPCYKWLFASGLPYMAYSRDTVHSGELGKQIIGEIMLRHFRAGAAEK